MLSLCWCYVTEGIKEMTLKRLLDFLNIIHKEFSDIITNVELQPDKLRIMLIDGSWIEIRYPVEDKFSFHWQRGDKIYRLDTAPHHKHIKTFPRHIHLGSEDNVVEDFITRVGDKPEENFRNFMKWVRSQL